MFILNLNRFKMELERNLVISVLKLTEKGAVLKEQIYNEANIARPIASKMLKKLAEKGLIYLGEEFLEADNLQRLNLAVYAVQLGADLEKICSLLDWKEFERVAVMVFARNGYSVKENLRFKHAERKWEMDIVACKKPLIVCVDCKHWQRGMHPSELKRITEIQVERTLALAECLKTLASSLNCVSWGKVHVVPAVLSLVPSKFKFYDNVPVVPIFQLQGFLSQLPAYVEI